MTFVKKCGIYFVNYTLTEIKMAQKLLCPMCHKILIRNEDLVIEKPVIFDIEKIKATEKPISQITCHNCKRRIKYFIGD